MPASAPENIDSVVDETLKASLATGNGIDQKLVSSAKRVLLHKVDFHEAKKPYSLQIDSLRAKYIPLNPSQTRTLSSATGTDKCNGKMNSVSVREGEDGLPLPKVILYPEDRLKLEWRRVSKIGSGLVNMGNTCFLNSTLQCLTYTAPLVNYCLTDEHITSCKQAGFCMVCELQRHIRRCFENSGHPIKPQSILQKLKMIAKHMHWGRQEDAHEFLRYVVDGLQKACLNGHAKLDKFSKETTVINQIFGGYLRSQVQCLKCRERSNTFDPFLDISLDIKNVQSVEKAFEKFVQPETLDNDNAYMCPRCKQKVQAHKRFSVHKAPNVLTVQLKRFDYNRLMGKVSRHIQFPDKLNIRPYMSSKQGESVMYHLYAVLVHSGHHCNSGHYYCYVKSPSQAWYCMNDSTVQQVGASRVFNAEAYLLFYTKSTAIRSQPIGKPGFIGPIAPNHTINSQSKLKTVNGTIGPSSSDIGQPISRTATPKIITHDKAAKFVPKPIGTPLPEKRDKVSFGIKMVPKTNPPETSGDAKPRIVVQIKNGKVTALEKSPDGKSKVVNGASKSKSQLVPYGEDSDSEQENKATKANAKKNGDSKPEETPRKADTNQEDRVVFDSKLNATTSVPGNAKLLESAMKRDSDKGECTPKSASHDLTLKLNKTHSLKRSLSDTSSLSCVTSPTSKVNATTSSWHVQNTDLAPSPSVGSCSSTNSVNSTTEWHVTDRGDAVQYAKVPERQHVGWKVIPEEADLLEAGSNCTDKRIDSDKMRNHIGGGDMLDDLDKEQKSCDKEHRDQGVPNVNFSGDKEEIMKTNGNHGIPETFVNGNGKSTASSSPTGSAIFANGDHIDVSEKLHLLSDSGTPDQQARKKHKKHKKHKKNHEYKYQELQNESSSSVESSKKHKKKKKKHKHKHDRDESERKHKHRSSDEEKMKRKHSSRDSEETQYEWVEKTKDSFSSDNNSDSKKSAAKEVPAQPWDWHSKDGGKKVDADKKIKWTTWDGSKTSKVVAELEKQSTSRGYGTSVLSWEGGRSTVDVQAEKDRERERKRFWEEDYEEDMDRGKVKKVKKHHTDSHFSGVNPFQRTLDERNKIKPWSGDSRHSQHHGHSHHGNGDHGRHPSYSHHSTSRDGGYRNNFRH